MMNGVWVGMILAALLCGICTGRSEALTAAMFSGAAGAVELVLSLLGAMCLWSGVMRVAERAGVTRALARLFSPILRLLFPQVPRNSAAARAICMNISANLLGMGNAATPFGLTAMREMAQLEPGTGSATDAMITFVVMNTACFQLIPSTIAVLRSNAGSAAPFDIMPCIWITSLSALTCGLVGSWLMQTGSRIAGLSRCRR